MLYRLYLYHGRYCDCSTDSEATDSKEDRGDDSQSAVSGDGECGGYQYSEDMEGIACTYGNVI